MHLPTGGTPPARAPGRAALALLAALACTMFPAAAAAAAVDDYPARPVRIVVGTPAGSGYDVMLRTMQDALQADLGQPIVIEQRVGADLLLAAREVAKSPADGYTLLAGTRTQVAVNPVTYANPGYDADRDLTPITLLGYQIMLIVVHPSLPVHTLAELAAYSRAHPDTLNYAAGSGSLMLVVEALKQTISADLLHIPFNGIRPSFTALLAGDVQVAIVDVPTALSSIRADRARALVVSGERRFPQLPDVPTLTEAGYANADMPIWNALYAPGGTPAPIVERVRAAVVHVLESPQVADRLLGVGIVPATSTPQELRARALRERADVHALVKRLGIAPR